MQYNFQVLCFIQIFYISHINWCIIMLVYFSSDTFDNKCHGMTVQVCFFMIVHFCDYFCFIFIFVYRLFYYECVLLTYKIILHFIILNNTLVTAINEDDINSDRDQDYADGYEHYDFIDPIKADIVTKSTKSHHHQTQSCPGETVPAVQLLPPCDTNNDLGAMYNPLLMYTRESIEEKNAILSSEWNATGHCDLLPVHCAIVPISINHDDSDTLAFLRGLFRHVPNSHTFLQQSIISSSSSPIAASASTTSSAIASPAQTSSTNDNNAEIQSLLPNGIPNAALYQYLTVKSPPPLVVYRHPVNPFEEITIEDDNKNALSQRLHDFRHPLCRGTHQPSHHYQYSSCSVEWCLTPQRTVYFWPLTNCFSMDEYFEPLTFISPSVLLVHVTADVDLTFSLNQSGGVYATNWLFAPIFQVAQLASRLGVRQALVVIDGMDRVVEAEAQERYLSLCSTFKLVLTAAGFITAHDASMVHFVPCSARYDWNLGPVQHQHCHPVTTAAKTNAMKYNMTLAIPHVNVKAVGEQKGDKSTSPLSWYHGPSVVELLDKLHISTIQLESAVKVANTAVAATCDRKHRHKSDNHSKSKKQSSHDDSSRRHKHSATQKQHHSHYSAHRRIIPTVSPQTLQYEAVSYEQQQTDITHRFGLKVMFFDVPGNTTTNNNVEAISAVADITFFVAGIVINGTCCVGERIVILPIYQPARIDNIVTCGRAVHGAFAGDFVLLCLTAVSYQDPFVVTDQSPSWVKCSKSMQLSGAHIPRMAKQLTVQTVSTHPSFSNFCRLLIPSIGYCQPVNVSLSVALETFPTKIVEIPSGRRVVVQSHSATVEQVQKYDVATRSIVTVTLPYAVPLFYLPRFQHLVEQIHEGQCSGYSVDHYLQYDIPSASDAWSGRMGVFRETQQALSLGQFVPAEHAILVDAGYRYPGSSRWHDQYNMTFQGQVMTAAVLGYQEE